MRKSIEGGLVACGLLAAILSGCGSTSRAMVHEEDVAKVFPWPTNKKQVTIRVKPKTFWVNSCSLLGSFEEVQVDPDITFYMIDKLDKKFAYTPSRSPIRRLAPVESMEIRWPVKAKADSVEPDQQAPAEEGSGGTDAPPDKPKPPAPTEDGGPGGGSKPTGS